MTRRPPRPTLFPYPTLFRSRLVDGRHARVQLGDLLGHNLDADDLIAQVGKTRRRYQADIVHAGHCDPAHSRSEEHTSELQSLAYLVCRLLLEKKKTYT